MECVWIVIHDWGDYSKRIDSVWSSEEKAEEYCEEKRVNFFGKWSIREFDVE